MHRKVSDERFLAEIERLRSASGYAPTMRELAGATGLALSTVHHRLSRLRHAGLVDWLAYSPRTLRVL